MGWTNSKQEVEYTAVKVTDDVEIAVDDDDWRNNVRSHPRRRLSGQHYRRLKHYALYSFVTLLALALQINYLAYKFFLYSLYPKELLQNSWLIVLLFCECVYLFTAVLGALDHVLPPSSRPDLGYLDTSQKSIPTVDIFIPCCKEPTDVPVEAVKAALALDYPSDLVKVFVLDDGGDDELRTWCDRMSEKTPRLVYIRRQKLKGVPHNFKCGNMNNGLTHSHSEYVVMMDADMILHPTYLRRLLPHIVSSTDVTFVQVPQAFYNLPVGDPLNDSCIMGYHRILPNRDSVGTASCVGTGTLFRRKHLDEIGGFQPQSITEDTMTAYTLFNRGYESVYVDEKLQIGLTPWTFEGYVKQRTRWGKGAIQQWCATWRICLGPSSQLNFLQKLYYLNHTYYYFVSFVNALLIGTLLAALAFNWRISIGTDRENIKLMRNLTLYLVTLRLSWHVVWLHVPQGVMMRNREESHFWWMTPYFMNMCVESLRNFKSTFEFVPSSNIDRNAAAEAKQSSAFQKWITKYAQVKWHLAFIVVAMAVVCARVAHAFDTRDCDETFLAVGLSVFLVSVSAHMAVPVAFLAFSPNYKPADRKKLIRFNADGVPQFTQADGMPQWSWGVVPYEVLSWITLIFWTAVMVFVFMNPSGEVLHSWCRV